MDPYDPGMRILILMIGVIAILLCCSGCAGYTDNAKTIRFQVPALLDVQFEYNDRKGKSDPTDLKGIITPRD